MATQTLTVMFAGIEDAAAMSHRLGDPYAGVHILRKLNLSSRASAAAWGVRTGLV